MKRMIVAFVVMACFFGTAVAEESHVYLQNGKNLVGLYVVPETDDVYQLIPGLQKAQVWDRDSQKLVELGHSGLRHYAANNSGFFLTINLAEPIGLEIIGEPVTSVIQVVSGWNFLVNPIGALYNFVQKDDNVKALWVLSDDNGFEPVSAENFDVGDGVPFWVNAENSGMLNLKNSRTEPQAKAVFAENSLNVRPPSLSQ